MALSVDSTPGRYRALAVVAGCQVLALSLWYSASAVSDQIVAEWRLGIGGAAGLTLMVQLGFVAGALLSALANVADVVPSRRLFFVSACAGAVANLSLLVVDANSTGLGFVLRFLTGLALAGVYPAGLKVMAGWFKRSRGMALGVLVGALTLGTASPHLMRGVGLEWREVVIGASLLAAVAAALMLLAVGDGPHETAAQSFEWRLVGRVAANRGVRLSIYGYLGHMWELYAMWTWVATFLAASEVASGSSYLSIPILTFVVIGSGALGSWVAGLFADRFGRTMVAGTAMAISGSCALGTAVVFGLSPWLVGPLMVIWGTTVVADSAQFSAMVTETAGDSERGTALTLQVATGFLLTIITIRGVPEIAEAVGWRWAFPVLAAGPAVGVIAMVALRRSAHAAVIAGGRG